MDFDSVDLLLKKLATDTSLSMVEDVSKDIIKIINIASQDIYRLYKPRMYKRRYTNGGFGDIDNIEITNVKATNRNIELEFRNVTEGTMDSDLDYMIEKGIYNFNPENDSIPPRPVYEPARIMLEQGNIVEKSLKKSLESKGWEINE